MYCPNCGAKISDNAVMCTHCNTFMDELPKKQSNAGGTQKITRPTVQKAFVPRPEKSEKKNVLLLTSAILGILYAIYSIVYWGGASSGTSGAEAIGAGIATALVMPHLICAILAAVFNTIGWAMNHRGFSLTGAILYSVSAVMFPVYFMFVIIQTILSFVGFAQLKKN